MPRGEKPTPGSRANVKTFCGSSKRCRTPTPRPVISIAIPPDRIKSWADANPALREHYRDLRASFEHLDGYLRLFTPFHRRLYRTPVEIAGAEIEKFLRDVFERFAHGHDPRDDLTRSRRTCVGSICGG